MTCRAEEQRHWTAKHATAVVEEMHLLRIISYTLSMSTIP